MMVAQEENMVPKFGYWIKIYIFKKRINIGGSLIPVGFLPVT